MTDFLRSSLRALRVELGVLVHWPVVWCLCLTVPAMMLASQLAFVIKFLFDPPNLSEPIGATETWALALNGVAPTVFEFLSYGSVFAMAVGAVIVAADWERGTVRMSRLAGSGRIPVAVSRAVGVWLILALSAALTFAAAIVVSALSGAFWPGWFQAGQQSIEPIGVLVHGFEVLALTNVAYGGLGLAAGALTRRVGPAVVLCAVFTLGVERLIFDLGTTTTGTGVFAFLFTHTPEAASETLQAQFGVPGGGGIQQPTSSQVAHTTLWICFLGFAAVQALLALRCGSGPGLIGDRLVSARRALPRLSGVRRAVPGLRSGSTLARSSRVLQPSSMLAAVRAELAVVRGWPGIIALMAVLPIWSLVINYVVPYGLHLEGDTAFTPSEYVPWLLPHHVLDVTMNYLDPNTDPLGVAALVLLGAWLSASSWGAGGTLSLALTQGQSRAKVVLGQATTAIFLAAFSALASLAVAVIASELLRLALTGDGSLPSIGHLAAGVGETLLITSMYVAIGWTIGLLVKSTAVAMVIVLGWVLVLQPTVIDYVGPLAHGVVHWIYNILPGTPALTLAYAQGTNNSLYGGGITPTGGPPGLTTSIWLLCAYTLIAIAIAAVIAARREVHGRQA